MKKIILFLVLAGTSSLSYAAVNCNGTNACAGPARELITQIFPSNSADAVTLLSSPTLVASLPCSAANGGPNIRLERQQYDSNGNFIGGHRSFEETYALALAAIVADEKIVIRVNDAPNAEPCTVSYIALSTAP